MLLTTSKFVVGFGVAEVDTSRIVKRYCTVCGMT